MSSGVTTVTESFGKKIVRTAVAFRFTIMQNEERKYDIIFYYILVHFDMAADEVYIVFVCARGG